MIVRDATPGRANDRDWQLVGPFERNSLISEAVLTQQTSKLFAQSKKLNCRYYAIVRDETGESKQRYKSLLKIVEGRFYKLERSEPWAAAGSVPVGTPPAVPAIGGPLPLGR